MELKRVVVTGLGAISPLGNDVATTWENAKAGVSGAGPITHFDASLFKTQFACEVKGFKAEDHFDRRKARQLDLYAQYALVAARQAVADAGPLLSTEWRYWLSFARKAFEAWLLLGYGNHTGA